MLERAVLERRFAAYLRRGDPAITAAVTPASDAADSAS
jgi:hypothetical protein